MFPQFNLLISAGIFAVSFLVAHGLSLLIERLTPAQEDLEELLNSNMVQTCFHLCTNSAVSVAAVALFWMTTGSKASVGFFAGALLTTGAGILTAVLNEKKRRRQAK